MIVAYPVCLQAQEAETQAEEDQDIVELSPFTITASENVGYAATSTLAGTRLKTELRDVGAAISVYTEEFMVDIAARNSTASCCP